MELKSYFDSSPGNWNNNLNLAAVEVGFCQSVCWADILGKVDNARTIYLEVYDDEKIISSLLLFHKIPWDRENQKIKKGVYEYLSGKHKGWLLWMDGPAFYSSNKTKTLGALKLILGWIDDYAVQYNLYKAGSLGFSHLSKWANDREIKNLFTQFGYKSETKATYLVDLTLNENEIWQNLKSSARKSIKKSEKQNIKIVKISSLEEYRNKFYLPYVEMENEFGRATNPWKAEEIQWNVGHEKFYHYFVAETENDEIIATLGMYIFNGTATEIASSMGKKAFEEKLPAQDLLHWKLILAAKKLGCHTFDLAGVSTNPADLKEAGIRQFKEKWGGRYTEYFTFNKLSYSWYGSIVNKIEYAIRKILNK